MGVLARAEDGQGTDLTTDPAALVDELSTGYRASQILLTAHRLGVFCALRDAPKTAERLARELQADERATRMLSDAVVAIGLLGKEAGRYHLAAPARACLLPDSPKSKYALLTHTARLYERWGKLYDAVRSGRPVSDESIDPRLSGDRRDFARAMADVGRESARLTADALDLTGVERVLDVGGGPGLYALEFARREPRLHAVVLDTAETLEVARANVAAAALDSRITLRAADAFADDLGGPYDVVLLSNFLHIYSAAENQRLITRCADVLRPGGRLVVKDFVMDPDRTAPAGGALFALTMLLSTEAGDCYTTEHLAEWFAAARLGLERTADLTPQSRLVIGVRDR